MNAKRLQSLCAALLFIGCVLVSLGAWGTWHFGSKSASEKPEQALQSQHSGNEASPPDHAIASGSPVPQSTPQSTPQVHSEVDISSPPIVSLPTHTPALISFESCPSASPSPAPAAKPHTSWDLSDKQYREIVDMLGKHAGKTITIVSVESDASGFAFAGTLKRAFEEAGWHVDGVKQVSYAKPPVGLNIAGGSFPSPEGVVIAFRTLTSAGFQVSQQLDAKLATGQAELIVGAIQ